MKRGLLSLGIFLFLSLSIICVSASLNVTLSDHGSNVTDKTTGQLLSSGSLTIEIWDAASGGNLAHNETFSTGISQGSWSVAIGENSSNNLSLEFGKAYYKDYKINGEDLDFTNSFDEITERQLFYSPLGDIGGEDVQTAANLTINQINSTSKSYFTNADFNGGWTSGGVSVIDGKIYADTGLFYNLSKLNVNTLNINGSLFPALDFDNTFDLGNSTLRWANLHLGGTATASEFSGALNWSFLQNYPTACLSSQTITAIGDSITCTDISITESQISNFGNYYLATNPFGFWNDTYATFNKTYADTLYAAIGSAGNPFDQTLNTTSNVTFNLANITNILTLIPSASAPGVAYQGSLFYNSTSNYPMYYNGSSWIGLSGVPQGAIAAFNSASCPAGWTEFTDARGRYIVGIPSGGTLAATVGTALTNSENRAVGEHNHGVTDNGHTHSTSLGDAGTGGSSYFNVPSSGITNTLRSSYGNAANAATGISINNAGSVAGTNAPYIQLTWCQKTGQDSIPSNSFWGNSGFNLFVQNTSLNVGIGTASPTTALTVIGGLQLNATGSPFPTGGTGLELGYVITSQGYIQSYSRTASTWQNLSIDASTIMLQSNSGGNVGIGITSPTYQLQLSTDNAAKLTTTTWSTGSDSKIKTDIKNFTDGMNVIMQINPINFKFNGLAGKNSTGGISILADRLKEIAPYMVMTQNYTLTEKDMEIIKKYGIDEINKYAVRPIPKDAKAGDVIELDDYTTHAFFFIFINAFKEQQKMIEQQNQTINSQKSEIDTLKLQMKELCSEDDSYSWC